MCVLGKRRLERPPTRLSLKKTFCLVLDYMLFSVFKGDSFFSRAIRTRKTNLLRQLAPPEDLGMPYDPYKAELFQGEYVGVIDNNNSAELFGTYTCMNVVCERLTIDEFHMHLFNDNKRAITLLQNPEWILELMNRNKTQGGSEDSWNKIVLDFHLLLYIKALKVSYTAEWFERDMNEISDILSKLFEKEPELFHHEHEFVMNSELELDRELKKRKIYV